MPKKGKIKLNKEKCSSMVIALIVSIIYFIISNVVIQPKIFKISNTETSIIKLRLNIIFFIFLFISFYLIITFIKKIKRKDKFYKQWIFYFICYFFIMLFFLLLIWPGHWVWDEFVILNSSISLEENIWQSYITVIYMSICLMIFPSPISIVIVQNIILSVITSYAFVKLYNAYKNRLINGIFFIFMIFPSIIINNLYPLRLTIYAYLMLLFFTIVIFDYKEKKNITIFKLLGFTFLNLLLMLWRSEGIIFAIIEPILIVLTYKNINKKILSVVVMVFVNILILKAYNSYFDKVNQYSLTIYINPLSQLVQKELKGKNIEQDLENINKVLDVDILKKYPSYVEIDSYWSGEPLVKDNWEKNMTEFKKSYIKIVSNNLSEFFKARLKTFLATSCDYNEYPAHIENRFINQLSNEDKHYAIIDKFLNEFPYTRPINKEGKIKVEKLLIGDINIESQFKLVLRKIYILIFWNVVPIIILQVILLVISIVKKKYMYIIIFMSLLGSSSIIFLTAPANYFMYYFPIYMCGIIVSLICIAQMINNKRKKKRRI